MTKETAAVQPARRSIFELQPGVVKHMVLDPGTDEPTGFEIDLISMDDDRIEPLVRAHNDKKLKAAQRGQPLKAEEIEEYGINLVSNAIVGWRFHDGCTVDFNGAQPEFTPGMARNIVKRCRWLLKQLDTVLGDTSRFFQG